MTELTIIQHLALIDLGGERGRNRTYNLLIKSHLLCQLSWRRARLWGWTSAVIAANASHRTIGPRRRTTSTSISACSGSQLGTRLRRFPLERSPRQSGRCRAAAGDSPRPTERISKHLLQNGHAVPTVAAPVAASPRARIWLTRWPVSSPRNTRPPPAPQQNDRSRARGGSTTVADWQSPIVVHRTPPVAAEITGIVENDCAPKATGAIVPDGEP